ncbi:hypothetical protein COOONC_23422 [Cooperia oncophora]
MLLFLAISLSLSPTLCQRTDSRDSGQSSTLRPATRSAVPNVTDLQNATRNAVEVLNKMIDAEQNQRNINLFRRAVEALQTALQSVQNITYDRETLRELAGPIRRLNAANLDDDSNDDDDNDIADRVEHIMDAASEIIRDYCD